MEAPSQEQPWLTDLRYGGMTSASAEKSWRAGQQSRSKALIGLNNSPNYDEENPPLPKSLSDYGLSPDWVSESALEQDTISVARRTLSFTPFSEILLSTASRYTVKGIIPNLGLVVVWGAPKCGKSFFVFDMVARIAAGLDYREHRVKQCSVVYFALEGQEGFVARVEAFRQAHGICDIPFFLSSDRILLPNDGEAIVRSIKCEFPDVRPGVVVLDTLNRSIAGSENDPSDMGNYVRTADMIREAFNCVVIIIHHCGVEGTRPRGHTSLTGAADAQIAVKRDAANNIVATVEFLKDGPEGATIVSYLDPVVVAADEDGDAITSCVIRPTEALSSSRTKPKIKGATARFYKQLCEAIADKGDIPPHHDSIPVGVRTVTVEVWRAYCDQGNVDSADNPEARRKAFSRASNKLQDLKMIGVWGGQVWIA